MGKTKTVGRRREAMGGLAKGLGVIRAFTRDRAALSLSEIAGITNMPAATARRCLLTLEDLGYVTRSGRQFLLRPKVLELGAAYLESMNIELLTTTHLEELARNTGDSAALCVLDGTEIVYVARVPVKRFFLIVLDGLGCGAAHDAAAYGDVGSDTLGNTARAVGGFRVPTLEIFPRTPQS